MKLDVSTMGIIQLLVLLVVWPLAVHTHSWVETVRKIGSSGSFVGDPGYSMGYINRDDPKFKSDDQMLNKILDTTSNPTVCAKFAQGDYSNPKFQPLKAAAGDHIAMQYEENGHVTQPFLVPNKPYRSGNVYVYGTLEHTPDAKLNDVRYKWTADGTGGNQKGKLLAAHFYDDGQCYQDRGAAGSNFPIFMQRKQQYSQRALTCQTDLQLPADLPSQGVYTLYWVWDWPTNNGLKGNTTEIYTSCAQINLAKSDGLSAQGIDFSVKDITKAAVQSQLKTPIEVLTLGVGSSSPPAPTVTATGARGTGGQPIPTSRDARSSNVIGTGGRFKTVTVTASPVIVTTVAGGSGNGTGNGGRNKTVTVTADAQTVTQWQTVTVGGNGRGNNSGDAAGAPKTSTPKSAVSSRATTLQTSVRPSASASAPNNAGAPTTKVVVTSVTPFM
jgi:hypothetical protein